MKIFAGTWPTVVTPYQADLKVDFGAYRELIEWYIAHGVGGLYANCLSSEMFHLDNDERLLLVSEATKTAHGRVPVAATGNLGDSVEEHTDLCRRVAGAGADVVMLVVPEFHADDPGLERYFTRLAKNVDADLGLYECPVPRPFHLSVELVGKLSATGRFHAYKETSGDIQRIQNLLGAIRGTPLALLQANTPHLVKSIQAGAPGTMSIAAAWLPDLVSAVIAAVPTDPAAAAELHGALCAMELAQRAVHPQGTKYLLSKRGLPITHRSRLPASPMSPEVLAALDYSSDHWFFPDGTLRAIAREL
jgi:4-hydroxy-tetrahydrodipicolinate synthase